MAKVKRKLSVWVLIFAAVILLTGGVLVGTIWYVKHHNDVSSVSENQASLTVKVGEQFKVELPSNASTGYSWATAPTYDTNVVQLENSTYESPSSNRAGASGNQVVTFKAIGTGTTHLVFNYLQPWQTSVQPAETRTYTVTVK